MTRLYHILLTLAAAIAACTPALALDLSSYTESSRLASGHWVKVAVPSSGIYHIPASQLRRYGFSDPTRVQVYGYGGATLPLELSADTYVDDLPPVQQSADQYGITFYGVGPETWRQPTAGRYVQSFNIYDTYGYYYLSDVLPDEAPAISETASAGAGGVAAVSFNDVVYHEQNLTTASNNGWLMVGEDFRFTPSRSFQISLPGRVEGTDLWMQTSFIYKGAAPSYASLEFTANGQKLTAVTADRISGVSDVNEIDGREALARRTFSTEGENLTLGISFTASGNCMRANLNYITVNYTRRLEMPSGNRQLAFRLAGPAARLSGASERTEIWDVTNPADVRRVRASATEAGSLEWTADDAATRSYVAWTGTAALPQPVFVENVSCQNLHAMTESPDMLIITPIQWRTQATRLADMHRNSASAPLKVEVVTDRQIYNEFSSGTADVGALRRFCKMLYDRSQSAAEGSGRLKYVLLFGAATYDNRHIEETTSFPTLPAYYPGTAGSQLAAETAYGTDDLTAMLEDGSGNSLGRDRLSVAVGRIPVRNASEANATVDKILRYCNDSKRTMWKNRVLMVADDGNSGIHAIDTDRMANALLNTDHQPYFVDKVYIDAYEFTGGEYPGARSDMYRMLDEGLIWWTYVGHANTTSWTSENLLNLNDINTLYVKHPPMLYSATCLFLKWDANVTCGGEILFNEPNGGIIGAISATRPVYISANGDFTESLGQHMGRRDDKGRMLTIGETYRRVKNEVSSSGGGDTNLRRFVLMGDPALHLAVPDYMMTLDAVDGKSTSSDEQIVVAARSNAVFSGRVTDADGNTITDFNGTALADLYDAERSFTTKGHNDKNPFQYTFERQGDRIFSGSTRVTDGHFEMKVSMPSEISDNFRPAAFVMYAYSDDAELVREAAGVDRSFYVYGFDENAPEDNEAPVIHTMALNSSKFADGDIVNTSPLLLATMSDNLALNLSSAGIGHTMSVTIDGNRMYSDVSQYFTPATDGSPSGSLAYPLPELSPGDHTLRLRVWDTSGNPAERTIFFTVAEGISPQIVEVFSDANPARTTANFYVRHDRPEGRMDVTVTVYDMMGREMWSGSMTAASDMDLSAPLSWDLTDSSGRRLQRGIYLYKAEIRTQDGGYTSASKRIAVAAP